jgi:hypothetical protein
MAVGWRVLAGAVSLAAWVLFALGVTRQVLQGFDSWGAGFVACVGVWAALFGWYALTGWRPEVRWRVVASLLGGIVGGGIGILATPAVAELLAPGSETAPTLVAIYAVPLGSTLGLVVGWCLPRRTRSERERTDVPRTSE